MKSFLILVTLGLIVFVIVYKQRLYLRDPMAHVTRDGIVEDQARVMINYSNDVLIEDFNTGSHRVYLIQNPGKIPGAPSHLICLTALVCMTDADQATTMVIVPGKRGPRDPFLGPTMSNKKVEFLDDDGSLMSVTLR